ncbi:MAG TPA: glycoside hydrolase family 172 protein [Fimbriimonadaceae bacterium]|nr:glycoside hydrolase family 172 protein [Fimbriimonadaceae bacterium]
MSHGPLSGVSRIVAARSRRSSSFDTTGGNDDWTPIGPGEKLTLLDVAGAGIVKHIWCTINSRDPHIRRKLVLRMFWDGQDFPSVEAPIGDFFGQGWCLNYNFVSMPLAAAPRNGGALVCYFPMPFGSGAKIEVENQSDMPVNGLYYYVDYEAHDSIPSDEGRFHAWYHQELTGLESGDGAENAWVLDDPSITEWPDPRRNPDPKNTTDANNYLFCEIEGEGHYVGVNYYVHAPSVPWPGEGDDMFLVDCEPWPCIHGTGTEDYFNTAWGPDEHYLHPYFGIAYAPGRNNDDPRFGWIGRMHYYRFHLEDPVRFSTSLRASIEHGHANGMVLDLASVAYWYQRTPSRPLPPLPSAADRVPRAPTKVEDIHRWRHAWLKERGMKGLWGDEK